jgi:uncharacterized protein YqeY
MTLREDIGLAIQNAMRSKDETRLRVLRLLLSAIKLADTEKGVAVDDAVILTLVQKEIKIRKDSIEGAEAAGRPEMVAQNQQEIIILESYLPRQLTEEELASLAAEAIQEAQASSPADMGKVMKLLMPRVQGKSPNAQVSQVVRKLLEK